MTSNTWPGGRRHAMSQDDHVKWNSQNYPGTRELCSNCEEPTGNCEEDSLTTDDFKTLCAKCWEEYQARKEANEMNKQYKRNSMNFGRYDLMNRKDGG